MRSQLERLLQSEDFVASDRLQSFLEFVVEAVLAGRAERIKAFTIAVEVFGRDEDFDPQADPIVRVEAGRLRRRLQHYYLTAGGVDPIVIEIPKGTYVPRFSYRATAGEEAESRVGAAPQAEPLRPFGRRALLTLALSLGLLIAVGSSLWWFSVRVRSTVLEEDSRAATEESPIRVLVMPFEYVTDTTPHPLLSEGLVNELIATLAALPNVEVLALGTAKQAIAEALTPVEIADTLQVDYLIRGEVRQQQARIRAVVTVIELPDDLIRSTRRFEGSQDDIFDLEEKMARGIANAVAVTATPALERRFSMKKEFDPEVVALYYQATTLRDPPSDPVRSRLAEEAFRRVIELDPEFAGAYAGMAYVLAARSWWRVGEQPERDGERALEAARMAVEKDPELGWAYATLGFASNVTGDHEAALVAARRAAELSKGDPYALAFSALVSSFEGETDAAIPLAKSALRLDPLSVRTPFRNILGTILFQAGRYQESIEVLQENVELGGPDGPHMAYLRAGSLAALGRTEEARRELERASAFPYVFDMRDFLTAYRDPRDGAKLLDVLRPLGYELDTPDPEQSRRGA